MPLLTEAEEIALYIAKHGVTRCPTMFAAPTQGFDFVSSLKPRKKNTFKGNRFKKNLSSLKANWGWRNKRKSLDLGQAL